MRRLVRGVVEDRLRPHADALARGDEVDDGFPRRAFDEMADPGLFRIPFRAPLGRTGRMFGSDHWDDDSDL